NLDDDVWAVEGAAAFTLGESIGVQVSGFAANSRDGARNTSFSVDGHLNLRTDQYLIGAFAGAGELVEDQGFWTVGVEGEYYLPSWTFAAAGAYANLDDNDSDGGAIDLQARWFATENLRLQAEAGWATISAGDSVTVVDDFGNLLIFDNDS